MTENTPDAVKVAEDFCDAKGFEDYMLRAGAILGARAMQAAMPGREVREDYAAICKELGCIEKPGVPLRFIQEMRKNLTAAGERIDWLLRSWDDATITERQELDRMRRGWGPTTPTERMLRHRDLRDCMQALSIALTDLTTPEDNNADPEVEARLQEAYDRVNKQYLVSLEILRRLDEPQPRPDLSAIEDAGAREGAGDLVEGWWRDFLEKDDRTSPEEYPDMILVSFDEIRDFAEEVREEAASRIEALEAEVAREKLRADAEAAEVNVLTHQRDAFRVDRNIAEALAEATEAELAALRAEVERKDKALEPFAAFADALSDECPDNIAIGIFAGGSLSFGPGGASVEHLRKARAALSPAKGG